MPKTLLALASIAALAVAAAAVQTPTAPYNLERAIAAQRALADERPDDAAIHNDLGNLLVLARDYEGAAAAYARALEIAPDNVVARFNRALLLEKQGERRAAFKELKGVVERDPRHAWAHYEIGKIYQAWRLDSLAERAYANAFRIEPRLADARTNPHVLDNPLVTRALLRAHAGASEELQPPRTYEEPARIAALMIDRPAGQPAEEQLAAEPAEPGGGFVRSTRGAAETPAAAAAAPGEEETAEGEPAKTLTARDLEPGRSTNQIGGGAPGVAVMGGAATSRGGSEPPITSGSRRTRPGSNRTAPTRPGFAGAPPQGSPSNPTPPFEPGPDSTGRLTLELVPPADGAIG